MSLLDRLFARSPRRGKVRVAIYDPFGSQEAEWLIGAQVDASTVAKYFDPGTKQLHAIRAYREGKPETHVCSRTTWEKVVGRAEGGTSTAERAASAEEQRIVGAMLLSLGQCKSNVVVASPVLDSRYRGAMVVNARVLATHISRLSDKQSFRTNREVAVVKALLIWLKGADILDPKGSRVTDEVYSVIHPYLEELINRESTRVQCTACKELYEKVTVTETVVDDSDTHMAWDIRWSCPAGHVLYEHRHQVFMSVSD